MYRCFKSMESDLAKLLSGQPPSRLEVLLGFLLRVSISFRIRIWIPMCWTLVFLHVSRAIQLQNCRINFLKLGCGFFCNSVLTSPFFFSTLGKVRDGRIVGKILKVSWFWWVSVYRPWGFWPTLKRLSGLWAGEVGFPPSEERRKTIMGRQSDCTRD